MGLECSYARYYLRGMLALIANPKPLFSLSSDVWSLGVLLLELAYGRCPYKEHELARHVTVSRSFYVIM